MPGHAGVSPRRYRRGKSPPDFEPRVQRQDSSLKVPPLAGRLQQPASVSGGGESHGAFPATGAPRWSAGRRAIEIGYPGNQSVKKFYPVKPFTPPQPMRKPQPGAGALKPALVYGHPSRKGRRDGYPHTGTGQPLMSSPDGRVRWLTTEPQFILTAKHLTRLYSRAILPYEDFEELPDP